LFDAIIKEGRKYVPVAPGNVEFIFEQMWCVGCFWIKKLTTAFGLSKGETL
jgi:hypothetical protein